MSEVARRQRATPESDLSSVAAFSLLFVVPAAMAVSLWLVLRVLDAAIALGHVSFFPWVLVVLAPAIPSAAIAHWACRRSGTGSRTAWGFALAAGMLAVLFAVGPAVWLLAGGE